MKKKIILLTFCLILFLIFTALGYAWGPNPKERIKEHPWGHALSSKPDDDRNLNFVLLLINPDLHLVFTFQSKVKNLSDSDELANQKLNSSIKHDFLGKNETRLKK